MADSLSQYSKHSDDLAQNSVIQAMMDPETKSRVSGVNNNNNNKNGGNKNEKFVKTMKKLPDVKMGHLEGGKNLTFSSDSEDPANFVTTILMSKIILIGRRGSTSHDQGWRDNKQPNK